MSGRKHPLSIASTRSVLDEMFTAPAEDAVGAMEVPAPAVEPAVAEVGPVSVASTTPVEQVSEQVSTGVEPVLDTKLVRGKAPTNRTPAGKTRYTAYISADVAKALDAAADRLVAELGGLVPKYRALDALIMAGIGEGGVVAGQLRAELMAGLQDPTAG